MCNYIPISLISIVRSQKRKRWVKHIEKHKMLAERQFGKSNLISYYDRVAETLEREMAG